MPFEYLLLICKYVFLSVCDSFIHPIVIELVLSAADYDRAWEVGCVHAVSGHSNI